MGGPSHTSSRRKSAGEQLRRNPYRVKNQGGVEFYIGVDGPLGMLLPQELPCLSFHGRSQVEKFRAYDLLSYTLENPGARVFRSVHSVPEAHNPISLGQTLVKPCPGSLWLSYRLEHLPHIDGCAPV